MKPLQNVAREGISRLDGAEEPELTRGLMRIPGTARARNAERCSFAVVSE